MTVKNAAADVLAAVSVMTHARNACARLNPLSDPMTLHQLQQRADMIDKVIRARSKLQHLRNRAAALEDALARFKARREAKMRMIANTENNRRHGLSAVHAICIIVACTMFVLALLVAMPDS